MTVRRTPEQRAASLRSLEVAREALAKRVARRKIRQAAIKAELEARAREAAEGRVQLAEGGKPLTPRQIIAFVAAEHHLNVGDIVGRSRVKSIKIARWAAVQEIAEAYPHRSRAWVGKWVNLSPWTVYTILHPEARAEKQAKWREYWKQRKAEIRHAA